MIMNKTQKKIMGLAFSFVLLAVSSVVSAGDVTFTFDVSKVPDPPKIISVTNSTPLAGYAVTVYANIEGQVQNSECCDGVCAHQCEPDCDFSACAASGFSGVADPRIVPNPTCIPNTQDSSQGAAPTACQQSSIANPELFYYFLDDVATVKSVGMAYDAATGYFTGVIPQSDISLYSEGDEVTYYIVASDNMGNVVSQTPSSTDIPCVSSSLSAWVSSLSTPAINNCSAMNSYEMCEVQVSGTPSCGAQYTVNDPDNDTCDMGGAVDASLDQRDILGFSAGVADNQVCTLVKLDAAAPDIGDNSEDIVMYIMTYINNDVPDPNSDDLYMPNATIITYAPGIAGIEPNLVSVLWDGECLTNVNSPDIFNCKSIVGGGAETRLIISSSSTLKSILFMANNHFANGKTIAGATSKSVTQIAQTGVLRFDGGTPFWEVDKTAALSLIHNNQSFNIVSQGSASPPAAPLNDGAQTCVNGDGATFSGGACGKSNSEPTSNICRISIKPSPDASIVDEYRIYRAETNDVSAAISAGAIHAIASNLGSVNTYDDTINDLDGKTYYYFFSAYDSDSGLETQPSGMSVSECTVEDWAAPAEAPQSLVCATPEGFDNRCQCSWTSDTVADPSVAKFKLMRDGALVTDSLPAAPGVTRYDITDADSSIIVGQTYSYSVTAIDVGNNESPAATATCVAEDLKAPEKVSDFQVFRFWGGTTLDADIWWDGVIDDDAAYYNIYKCENEWGGISCVMYPQNWTKVNSSPIAHLGAGERHEFMAIDLPETGDNSYEGKYCFWIEACDNCVVDGACELSEPNCSAFDMSPGYRECVDYDLGPVDLKPSSPQNVIAAPLPEGGKCRLTWDRVTTHSTGEPFVDPDDPPNWGLMGYAIMSAPQSESVSSDPFRSDPVAWVPKSYNPEFVHSGLVNGTTYQYVVTAYNSYHNYSSSQRVVECTPAYTAPAAPVVNIDDDNSTCNLSWSAVQEQPFPPVTYSVHRCDGGYSSCVATGDFPSDWGDNLGFPYSDIADLELSDFEVDLSITSYTYCVTAKDAEGNESDLFGGAESVASATNCGVCMPTGDFFPLPPSNVVAVFDESLKITYENSLTFDEGGGGHNLYLCVDSACATKYKLNSSPETADHSTAPYEADPCHVLSGRYYFGVSYVSGFGEDSSIAISAEPVEISSIADYCWGTQFTGTILERKLVSCGVEDPECKTGSVKTENVAFASATFRIVNKSTREVLYEEPVEQDGAYPILISGELWGAKASDFEAVIHIPAESYSGVYGYCENAATAQDDGCDMHVYSLDDQPEEMTARRIVVSKTRLVSGETPGSLVKGGGGEIGNANGDRKINIGDLTEMKKAYNSVKGDQCYAVWADFDLNGKVNLADMSILRENYNTIIPVTQGETFEPTLRSSNPEYAIPACCATKTCP